MREALLGPYLPDDSSGGSAEVREAVRRRWDAAAITALAAVGFGSRRNVDGAMSSDSASLSSSSSVPSSPSTLPVGGEAAKVDSGAAGVATVGGSPITLDTVLEGGGKNLSQGQRQLICIARALVVPTSLIVCDEGTSSLDARTEHLVWNALLNLPSTIVCICHRLDRIAEFDQVFVLDGGRVVESGPPRTLIDRAEGGCLAELVKSYNTSHG